MLDVELSEERNPAIRDSQVAEATLHLKGTTLRARKSSTDMGHSINLMADDLARQVKKHRDKRRGRREAQKAGQQPHPPDRPPRGFPSGIGAPGSLATVAQCPSSTVHCA